MMPKYSARIEASDAFGLGYAMGLIVGEGTFTHHKVPALVVHLLDDPEPLRRLQSVLGGRVYGPYMNRSGTCPIPKPYYSWHLVAHHLRAALPLIDAALPASKKRVQFEGWREKYRDELLAPAPTAQADE